MKKPLVLFDIDGTLLRSVSKTLPKRFNYAFKTVYGIDHQVRWDMHQGSVDRQLILEEMLFCGVDEGLILDRIDEAYEVAYTYFRDNVDRNEYATFELPHVRQVLHALQTNAHMGVLTGNHVKMGWLKLELINMKHFFTFGLFGNEASGRIELAQQAVTRAEKHFNVNFDPHDICIIGDTPRDIACARAIGARVIATATGRISLAELAQAEPDLAVSDFSDPRILPFILNG